MRSVVDERRSNAPTARLVDYAAGDGAWAATPERRRPMLTTAVRALRAEWQALVCDPPPLSSIDITGLCVVWSAEMLRSARGVQ